MHRTLPAIVPTLLLALALPLHAQTKSCPIVPAAAPSAADQAFLDRKYDDAARLYAAQPPSDATTAGIVRTELAQRKLDDALAVIQKEVAAHPNDATLLDVLGEVRFRRGEPEEAAKAYNQAGSLDPCLARIHFDVSRYMNFNGLYASAQTQLDQAHNLAPYDPIILRAWKATQRVPLTADEQIARLREREGDASTDEQKAAIENSIKALQAREKGGCELAQPVASDKIPLYPEYPGQQANRAPYGSGVDVFFNGKRRRFRLDTGASGLMLSAAAAKALGLTPEAEVSTFGIGDEGLRTSYLAHVDYVKIGDLEFHNCMVRVLESKDAWRDNDGLLGPDIFRSFLVTLDLPGQQLRLSPLPVRPGDATETTALSTEGESPDAGLTLAERKRDRYVAPEMKDWVRIFRSGHDLIFPTRIGNAPEKLFIMDTGASITLISPNAAREVTHVGKDSSHQIHGISGEVKTVYTTDTLEITFANVRQFQSGLDSIDMSRMSSNSGVELSGFLGYPILRELVISIDYRDNLVHVSYVPHIEPGRR